MPLARSTKPYQPWCSSIQSNRFYGTLPPFPPSLTILEAGENQLTGTLPEGPFKNQNMIRMYAEHTHSHSLAMHGLALAYSFTVSRLIVRWEAMH